MDDTPTNSTTELLSKRAVKVHTKTTQIKKKKSNVVKWLKKTFSSSTEAELSYISRQDDVEGAVWTTSSTRYHPSGYYSVKTGSRISFYDSLAGPKSSFPHSRSKLSQASNKLPERFSSPVQPTRRETPQNFSIRHPDTLNGSFVHFRKDPTPTSSNSYSISSPRTPGSGTPRTRAPRNNGQIPPHNTYFDYLSKITHAYSATPSHAYGDHNVYSLPPPQPHSPYPTRSLNRNSNSNKKLHGETSYRNSKTRFPFADIESSHAYDANTNAGRTPASRNPEQVRDLNRADTLARLCNVQGHTAPMSSSSMTSSADSADWDVPLSQYMGSGEVMHQMKRKGSQIQNREKFVVGKREERRGGGQEVFKGVWERQGRRVEVVDVEGVRGVEGMAEIVGAEGRDGGDVEDEEEGEDDGVGSEEGRDKVNGEVEE
ncbi:hypothetical protein NX059_005880 [Plenodomus lindquistii]|nr:hypothetical protein NX059_005880 [Plenodomus lindquistii]